MNMGKIIQTTFTLAFSLAVASVPFGARGDAVADCARIFEAEMRDGVIHGAVVVAKE